MKQTVLGFVLVLILAAPAWAQEAPAAAPQAVAVEDLPPGREVVDRYIGLVGGAEAFTRCQAWTGKGMFSMPAQGIFGPIKLDYMVPNLFRMVIDIPGVGVTSTGFDGETGWIIQPMTGPMLVEGEALDDLKVQARFDHTLKPADLVKSLENMGVREFDEQDAYAVKVIYTAGHHMFEFYSVETGMLVGTAGVQESPMGPVEIRMIVLEHAELEGLKIPSKVSQEFMGMNQVIETTEMQCVDADPAVFDLPPVIQSLKAAQPAEDESGQ